MPARTGVTGIIGWYVPGWMVDKYPDITDWNNLNKYADLFKTSESGDKGQFLGSDPTFVQYDEALIANLGLNYKVIFSGSEAATITAFQQADQEQDAADRLLLRPAVAPNEIKLVQVKLPPYTAGCDADLKKVACDYPAYTLNKIVRTKFATERRRGARRSSRTSSGPTPTRTRSPTRSRTRSMYEELDAAKAWIDANPRSGRNGCREPLTLTLSRYIGRRLSRRPARNASRSPRSDASAMPEPTHPSKGDRPPLRSLHRRRITVAAIFVARPEQFDARAGAYAVPIRRSRAERLRRPRSLTARRMP